MGVIKSLLLEIWFLRLTDQVLPEMHCQHVRSVVAGRQHQPVAQLLDRENVSGSEVGARSNNFEHRFVDCNWLLKAESQGLSEVEHGVKRENFGKRRNFASFFFQPTKQDFAGLGVEHDPGGSRNVRSWPVQKDFCKFDFRPIYLSFFRLFPWLARLLCVSLKTGSGLD